MTKTWRQLLVTGGTVLALGACGPGLDSLGPFSIGGEITGLAGTDRVVLQNNGGDDLTFTGSGSFTFSTLVPGDSAYAVTVKTQPTAGLVCTIVNGSGTAKADVTTPLVRCVAPWTGIKQLGAKLGANPVETQGLSAAVDTSGNVYVAGYTKGSLGTDPVGQANALTGNIDLFLTKFDLGGNVLFTQQLGAAGANTNGNSVTLDSRGNVYVAGTTNGALGTNPAGQLNTLTRAGFTDFFVTKFDSNGSVKLTKQSGFSSTDSGGWSVGSDSSGNVYVAGEVFNGTTTWELFVSKYDSSWATVFAESDGVSATSTNARSVAVDAGGNTFYVAGYTSGNLAGVTKTGNTDAFLKKYVTGTSATTVSTRLLGVVNSDTQGNAVAVDALGNVYVAGYTNGPLAGVAKTGTTEYAFLTKYESNGNSTTQLLGVAIGNTRATSIAVNASGTVIYVAGYTTGDLGIQPGGQPNTKKGTPDAFITKYEISGNVVTRVVTQLLGVTNADTRATSVAVDTAGNVYLAGYTNGGLSGPLFGTTDFFVAKYNSSFVRQ